METGKGGAPGLVFLFDFRGSVLRSGTGTFDFGLGLRLGLGTSEVTGAQGGWGGNGEGWSGKR